MKLRERKRGTMMGRKYFLRSSVILGLLLLTTPAFLQATDPSGQDWKHISEELMKHFRGEIVSVEKLDTRSCWAVLAPETKEARAVKLAEQIGDFVKQAAKDFHDFQMMVRVFVQNQQVAIAVLEGDQYKGRPMGQSDLDPSLFKGTFRPQ